jgi:hypothetical protein
MPTRPQRPGPAEVQPPARITEPNSFKPSHSALFSHSTPFPHGIAILVASHAEAQVKASFRLQLFPRLTRAQLYGQFF